MGVKVLSWLSVTGGGKEVDFMVISFTVDSVVVSVPSVVAGVLVVIVARMVVGGEGLVVMAMVEVSELGEVGDVRAEGVELVDV